MGHPLEREFEGWAIRAIEDYLDALSIGYDVVAVSGQDEADWPSDVSLRVTGKVLGLQFKRPRSGSTITWRLDRPPDQYEKVKARKEIFYALPAFVDRSLRRVSLHHIYFWRPGLRMAERGSVDLGYVQRSTISRTWGELFLDLHSCREGVELSQQLSLGSYLIQLAGELRNVRVDDLTMQVEDAAVVHALWLDVATSI